MEKTDALRQQALRILIKEYPDSLVDDLFQQEDFISHYKLKTSSALTLSGGRGAVSGPVVFEAVRRALAAPDAEITFVDQSAVEWRLQVTNLPEGELLMIGQGLSIPLVSFWPLLPDGDRRIGGLEKVFFGSNMPASIYEEWRRILEERLLSDDEVLRLFDDIADLDTSSRSKIQTGWHERQINPETCVPGTRRYHEWRLAPCGSDETVEQFVSGPLRTRITSLLVDDPKHGLWTALDFCAHSSITDTIDLATLNAADLSDVFGWVLERGSCIAKVGAIEIGLMQLGRFPELAMPTSALIQQVCALDPDDSESDLVLFHALFIMVEAELTRLRLFEEAPPFYRRLLSITQATLIASALEGEAFNRPKFATTVMERSGYAFYLRTLCDLRREPRWLPDYAASRQLKNEMLGRIWIAGQVTSESIESAELRNLLFGDEPGGVKSQLQWLAPFLPGPLEGGLNIHKECPAEFTEIINEAFARDEVNFRTFVPIINAASLFNLEQGHTEMVSEALKRAKYFVKSAGKEQPLDFLLQGLAQIAATQRNGQLAEDLLILVRHMIGRNGGEVERHKLPMVGLIAAAGYSDIVGWSDFIGRWFGELTFSDVDTETMTQLYLQMEKLMMIEPTLYLTLSRAKAAAFSRLQVEDPNFN